MNKTLTIEVTTVCDGSCIICPRKKYKFPFGHMDFSVFKTTVDKAVDFGVSTLIFGGFGEAFLYRHIEQALQYVHGQYPDIKIQIGSTCNNLNSERLYLLEYIDVMRVSMYGMSKETYEKIHNSIGKHGVQFERSMENIKNILNLQKRPYLSMNYVILKENESQTQIWKEYWEPKVDEVQIWRTHNWGGFLYPLDFGNTFVKCFRPFSEDYVVRKNGDISICCMDINNNLILGNILSDNFEHLKYTEKAKTVRRFFDYAEEDEHRPNLICKYCDQRTDRAEALVYTSNSQVRPGSTVKY